MSDIDWEQEYEYFKTLIEKRYEILEKMEKGTYEKEDTDLISKIRFFLIFNYSKFKHVMKNDGLSVAIIETWNYLRSRINVRLKGKVQ